MSFSPDVAGDSSGLITVLPIQMLDLAEHKTAAAAENQVSQQQRICGKNVWAGGGRTGTWSLPPRLQTKLEG